MIWLIEVIFHARPSKYNKLYEVHIYKVHSRLKKYIIKYIIDILHEQFMSFQRKNEKFQSLLRVDNTCLSAIK